MSLSILFFVELPRSDFAHPEFVHRRQARDTATPHRLIAYAIGYSRLGRRNAIDHPPSLCICSHANTASRSRPISSARRSMRSSMRSWIEASACQGPCTEGELPAGGSLQAPRVTFAFSTLQVKSPSPSAGASPNRVMDHHAKYSKAGSRRTQCVSHRTQRNRIARSEWA